MFRIAVSSAALFFTLTTNAAFIGDVDQVRALPGYIDERSPVAPYFVQGRVNAPKMSEFIENIAAYRDSVYLIECQSETGTPDTDACDVDKDFQKKWKKNSTRIALDFARDQLQSLLQSPVVPDGDLNGEKARPLIEKMYSVLQIWESLRGEDTQRGKHSGNLNTVLQIPQLWQPDEIYGNRAEPNNLLVPQGHPLYGKQTFLSSRDLDTLKKAKIDVSLLDPPSSGVWRKPKKAISAFDTSRYDDQGLPQLRKLYPEEEVQNIVTADREISVVYKPQEIGGGLTPKFDVTYQGIKWKLKFITDKHGYGTGKKAADELKKLILGPEANVEPPVNNLAAALGYTIDPTYFKNRIRIYFEDKVYQKGKFDEALRKMIRNISERFNANCNVASALNVIKTDEQGRKYIEMKSVTLEQKSQEETDLNIGFFDRDTLDRDRSREHRALYLFLAFIGDADVKNENDKVKLVPDGNGSFKVMLSNSDMGGALGLSYPNLYNYNFINKTYHDRNGDLTGIRFNYLRIYPYPMQEFVNLNDAKWFARRLGQLTPSQFEAAFSSGGFPTAVTKYYALLAAKKRNQLLRILGLMGTSFLNDAGQNVTLQPIPEFEGTVPGYEKFFDDGRLQDPQNELYNPQLENFPRDWGVTLRIFDGEGRIFDDIRSFFRTTLTEAALRLFHKTVLNRGMLHYQGGLEFSNTRIIDHRLGVNCGNDCFVQGFDFGVGTFAPMRFLVDNPHALEDPDHMLWMVDLMRIGFFVGDRGEILQGALGFDAPSNISTAVGARAFKVYEIVKITPLKDMNDYFKNPKKLFELPRYALPRLRDQILQKLADDESLIVSTYTGVEMRARLRGPVFPFNIMGLRLGTHVRKASRVTILHQAGHYLANWSDENQLQTASSLNILDTAFIKLRLAEHISDDRKRHDRTFAFQDTGAERDVLLQSLVTREPPQEFSPFAWEKRQSRIRERSTFASLFGLRSLKRYVKKIETHYEDLKKSVETRLKAVTVAMEKSRLVDIESAKWMKKADLFVNEDGKTGLGVSFDLYYPGAKKEKVWKLLERYRSYFPQSLLFFDYESLKRYMGTVEATASIHFTQEMLQKIFSNNWTKESVCIAFPGQGCSRHFFNVFKRARSRYQKIESSSLDSRHRTLKQVARFFIDHDGIDTLGFAKTALAGTKLLENGEIRSSLSAFPGDHDVVEYGKKHELPEFDPKIFSDDIETALLNIFFIPSQ